VVFARFAAVDQAAAFEEQEHWDRRLSTLLQSRQAAVRAAHHAAAQEPAGRSRTSPPLPMQIGHGLAPMRAPLPARSVSRRASADDRFTIESPRPVSPAAASEPIRPAGPRLSYIARTRARRSASVPSAAQRANEGLPCVPVWNHKGPYRPPCRRSRERPAPCRRRRLRVYLPLAPDADDRDNPDGITHSARCRERLGHFRATNGFDQNLLRIVNIFVYRTFVARARRDSNSRPSVP
jgi:hypothetical protein